MAPDAFHTAIMSQRVSLVLDADHVSCNYQTMPAVKRSEDLTP
jgi:hypothetical protein